MATPKLKRNRRLFPREEAQLRAFGQRLREARLRRRITGVLFCERMGISRDTLNRMEKGDHSIAVGTYIRALAMLGLGADLDALAADDVVGERINDGWLKVEAAQDALNDD